MKYPDDFINKVVCGDCIEIMKDIPDNSVDTVITDPPYALGFMGKAWDRFPTNIGAKKPFANQSKEQKLGGSAYQKWTEDWAKEALRVAKPGATLLCFGGTRTYHRLACAIEDVGWMIKDCIMWLYGSGFPKSTNIAKNIKKQFNKTEKEWQGWGTHLKPAYEPIIVAMKPNDGSYADNALKWGVSGLNIDGGRIGTETEIHSCGKRTIYGGNSLLKSKTRNDKTETKNYGRFPANVILDEEAAKMLDEQSGKYKSIKSYRGKRPRSPAIVGDKNYIEDSKEPRGYNDIGGASRFFYVAKASKSERNMGCEEMEKKSNMRVNAPRKNEEAKFANKLSNHHPTVKPLKLMEYLCILTRTPTGGIVLDPFLGSGTTAMAAKKTGRDFIGIEQDKDYCKIAEARINVIKVENKLPFN